LQLGCGQRHALPKLKAFNFVLEEALQGGVNDSLNLDTHGKSSQRRAARDDARRAVRIILSSG
jgi:hypothetical protein